ncbi:hypothetical protein K432DRAFT_315835, partial [Lepidopterella palustris CBS 459.81]
INYTLKEYLDIFVIVYLDNILVLKKLKEFKLLVYPNKSEFYRMSTEFLGFIILRDRIAIN